MANADQFKALLQSHSEGDDQRFYSIAMQVAAREARLGHGKLAEEIRALIDEAKLKVGRREPTPISRPKGELASLLSVSYPKVRLSELILSSTLAKQIQRILREQRNAAKILSHGLSPRRKLLLVGPPGTGKTLSASVLASELGLPLCQVRLDGLLTKFMGETAGKLRQIFDATGQTRAIYFFDEFDSIGSQRGLPNDVGEIRRVLNSFLQMIEQDRSHSLIIAATNHPEILDRALFRRFDDVLQFLLPDTENISLLLRTKLKHISSKGTSWKRLANGASGLSYAEISRASEEVLKAAIIGQSKEISEAEIREMLEERKNSLGPPEILERG